MKTASFGDVYKYCYLLTSMVIRLIRWIAQLDKCLTVVLETGVRITVSPTSNPSCFFFNIYILYILNCVVFQPICFKAVIPCKFRYLFSYICLYVDGFKIMLYIS